MNPQMMQYGQPGVYPPQSKAPQHLAGQMQGLSLGQNDAAPPGPYRQPPQQFANGGPPNALGPSYPQTNGSQPPLGQQQYRPQPQGYPTGPSPGGQPPQVPPHQQSQPPAVQPYGAPQHGLPQGYGPPQGPNYPANAPQAPTPQGPAPQAYGPPQPSRGPAPPQSQNYPPAPSNIHSPQGPAPQSYGPPRPPQSSGPGMPGPMSHPANAAPGVPGPMAHPGSVGPGIPGPMAHPANTGPGMPGPMTQGRMPPPPGPGQYPPQGYPPQQGGMPPPQGPPGPPMGAQYGPGPGALPPQPGKPQYPQDGYGNQMQQPGYGGAPGYGQQSSRRIEPDQLPSVIQVLNDDEETRAGVFFTNQKGLVPPLTGTNFVVQDGGNCSPRFVRSTLYNVPITADIMKQTAVPFALAISPMARLREGEHPPPLVDMGELGPVRCIRCKAYMSPFMQFIDGGVRFHCLLCKASTEVVQQYFQHLDHSGLRLDRFERPELMLGAYEFVAPKEYCKNDKPPNPPAMVFVIDVSYNNVRSGLVHLLCARMKEILRSLPRMRVGFITYSSSVHFYNIKSSLAAPQMVIVGDVGEMFMPLLDGFLADPVESEAVIDLLMQEIPRQFADTRETETILLPAIQGGLEALKAAECAGKLIVFHSSLPVAEAPGKLKNRDDRKVLGTEKEKTVLTPQNKSYNEVGQDCVQAGCCVDLFLFNNAYIDLATIGQVPRLTGGEIFKYTYFQADIDGDRFVADLKMDIAREVAYDAIMKVRTSTGVRATDFYGHLFMSNTTDIELAAIDSDKAVCVEIKHDDKLTEEDGVYIQVALLYTHVSGQRRLRVLNLSLKACSQMGDCYRSADLETLITFFGKQGVTKLLELTPKQVKDSLTARCVATLTCYRKNCANPSSVGQLILPEGMKLLPVFMNSLINSDAIAGGSDMTVDDRVFAMHAVLSMDIASTLVYFYPRLVPLHLETFTPIRCSAERLQEDGLYLLDNGIHMFLWVGLSAPPEIISQLFGVPSAAQVDSDRQVLPPLENPLSITVREYIEDTRRQRHRHMRLTIVKQRDKLEMVMKHFMVEDSGLHGSPSYVDYLCYLHKEIRTNIS